MVCATVMGHYYSPIQNRGIVVHKIKELKVLLGVERKKIMFDTEKVRSLTCMEKNQVN